MTTPTVPTQATALVVATGATREDAHTMLQLARLAAEMKVGAGMDVLWHDDFPSNAAKLNERFPIGSKGRRYLDSLCYWYETVGTLVKNGLFDRGLCSDWLNVTMVWDRIRPMVDSERATTGDVRLWENFELLAESQRGGT
jgi:hypothetical protein